MFRSLLRRSQRTPPVLNAALVLSSLSLSACIIGCSGSSSSTPPPPVTPTITIKAPTSSDVDPSDSASLSATVANDTNSDGVTWSLSGTGCTGSACGALSNSSTTAVTYTAPATVATAFTVTITATSVANSSASATATLSVPINPAIATPAGLLAGGTIGAAYSVTLAGTGGITPYAWSITAGNLPAGLALNATTGAITGIPTAAGSTTFTVTLTDSGAPALTATASFTIAVVYPALSVTTTTLANATLGTAYSATLAASGGSGTGYTWTVTSGTGLSAAGLNPLSPAGVISGIPTTAENAVPFTVQVTDSAGNIATATLTLTVINVNFQGQVLSGQLPVAGATVQIYAVGNSGNGSASGPMLTQSVTTDSAGYFSIAGLYTCGQGSGGSSTPASGQVYILATGGTVGTNANANSSIALMTAVGNCTTLFAATNTIVNELTTVAAAWALAPFATSTTSIGATTTNTLGIDNAFLDAALLANPATGNPATLPTNLTVEGAKLNALADVLANCVESNGGANCSTLFTAATPTSGTTPTDTFTAALNIVKNPGQNVAAVYAAISTTPPYATTYTKSPNDWTMSLTVTGGGLFYPTILGIDTQNNVWVADEAGPLSAFNPQGTPLSATGFGIVSGVPLITDVYGLAIDPSNNIWVTNEDGYGGGGTGSVTEFYGVNNPATLGTSPAPTGYGSVYFPDSIAADTNGNIYAANTDISSVTVYNSTGTVVSPYLGQNANLASGQNAVAIDASHGFWIATNNQDVAHFSSTGALLVDALCCDDSIGIATDSAGNLWIADYSGGADNRGSISEAVTDSSGNTTVPISNLTTGGINYPGTVAVDSAQNVWFTNRLNGSISELAGINNTLPVATAISPSTGVYTTGGYGLDANLGTPYSLLPDRSGNLWVSNEGLDSVTMFFGIAAPTVTPLQPVPTAP